LYRALEVWWRIARPITVGVRVLMIRDANVLLVRHTYRRWWYFPGGGVKRGESLPQAIRREAAEEVGAKLEDLGLLGVYSSFQEHKSDHIAVFVSDAFSLTQETDREIEACRFFPLHDLPEDISPGTLRRAREFVQGDAPYTGTW
jgi:8-oxo-dGTP pyrophosphatase MutT (NUDIX family)